MIKLYYTTTKGENESQPKPYNSLGGYKSSTPVTNDKFDNLFGELSSYTIQNSNENQYIGLILKNEGVEDLEIEVCFERGVDCYSKLYIAAVDLIKDANGYEFMENIPTMRSAPLYAEFHEAEGEENYVGLGTVKSGEGIGLWFKREILKNVIIQDHSTVITESENNRVVSRELSKSDTIEIVFNFTEVPII